MKIAFDHEKYVEEQSKYILERVNNYDKRQWEFGGELLFDLHAEELYLDLMKMQKLNYYIN